MVESLNLYTRLNQVILDYLSIKGLHHTRETLCREIFDSQNVDALNSSQESFLKMRWGVFCDNYNSMFFDFPIVDVEFPNKESVVVNNIDANQSNVSDVMNVTLSPHLVESSPVMKSSDSLDSNSELLELLAKYSSILRCPNQLNDIDIILPFDERFGIDLEVPNLMEPNMDALINALSTSPELLDAAVNSSEDSSIVRSLNQLNDMDVILSFADAGYRTNLEGPTLMESNLHAPTNVLPTSPEFLDAAINSSQDLSFLRSLDQLNEMDVIREFARNVGCGTNWEGPTLMEPNVHAPTNALPTSSEFLDAAVNASQDSSILLSLDQFNETDIILPFARNDGYGTNLEGPTLMEPNAHAPTNALPTSSEFLDAAVNSSEDSSILRSFDQLNDMDVMHAFARNAEYGTNLEGPTLIKPNMNTLANALPTSPVFLDGRTYTDGTKCARPYRCFAYFIRIFRYREQ